MRSALIILSLLLPGCARDFATRIEADGKTYRVWCSDLSECSGADDLAWCSRKLKPAIAEYASRELCPDPQLFACQKDTLKMAVALMCLVRCGGGE